MQSSTLAPWGSTERRIAFCVFGAVALLIVIFLLRDASAFVNSAQDELIGHLGASAGFTVAAAGTMLVQTRHRPTLLSVLVAGAAITTLAELAQGLVPDRGIELSDVATGYGGVLVAAIGIEFVLRLFTRLLALRLHTAVASIASVILLAILALDLAPETIAGAVPDGNSCPFTTVAGGGERIVIGDGAETDSGCLVTSAGGLGLFGPEGATSLGDDTVLLSSPLDQLAASVVESRRLVVRTEFVTANFTGEFRLPGILLILRSREAGELMQIRTREQTIEVIGPRFVDLYRSLSYTQTLETDSRYILEVELTEFELLTSINGELVATNAVKPGWFDDFRASAASDDLTLYVGNNATQGLPFQGVIEWIEIES